MTARVIPIRSGSGRQPVAVEHLRDTTDELRVVAEEALDFAATAVHYARRIQTAIAGGRLMLAAEYADLLESLGLQASGRAKATAVAAKVRQAELNGTCPDGVTGLAHGRAA